MSPAAGRPERRGGTVTGWAKRERELRAHYRRETGEVLGPCLGAGHRGIVFKRGPNTVIKLTDSAYEATFFMWLATISGPHPGLPRAIRAGQIGPFDIDGPPDGLHAQRAPLYAIEREDVADLSLRSAQDRDAQDEYLRFHFCAEDIPVPQEPLKPHQRAQSAAAIREFLPEGLARLPRHQHGHLSELVDCVAWLVDRGGTVGWLHEGNLGQRGELIVIRDHSGSQPPIEFDQLAHSRPLPTPTSLV